MPISTVIILKYVQQCYVKWFWTISSLGAPENWQKKKQSNIRPWVRKKLHSSRLKGIRVVCVLTPRLFSHLTLTSRQGHKKNGNFFFASKN